MFGLQSDEELLLEIYILVGIILFCGTLMSKKYKSRFKNNLIFYIIYCGISFFPLLNSDILKWGSELYMIFIGRAFIGFHFFVFSFGSLFKYLLQKNNLKS